MDANDIYNYAMAIFKDNASPDNIYDVDMFIADICSKHNWEAEETSLHEFSCAVVMLIRDDTLLFYYGFGELSIIAAELLNWAGQHLE